MDDSFASHEFGMNTREHEQHKRIEYTMKNKKKSTNIVNKHQQQQRRINKNTKKRREAKQKQ